MSMEHISNRGFTTKRAEQQVSVFVRLFESSAGRKTVRGFTLIETMIAVTILTLATAGPLYTASRAIVAAEIARDQLTASYLAQEGIEYIRAMRDNEFLTTYHAGGDTISTTAWNNFLIDFSGCSTATCMLDTYPTVPVGVGSGLSLQQCSPSGSPYPACAPLYLAGGMYTQKSDIGGVQKSFRRTVQILDVVGTSNDKQIVSKVTWDFHGSTYSVTITDHLTPWQ